MAQVGRMARAALARTVATRGLSMKATGARKNLSSVLVPQRAVSSSALRMHGHGHADEEELVALHSGPGAPPSVPIAHHDHDHDEDDEEDDEDMEEMVVLGPAGKEWGGPTRGGKFKEPTRYGDWERKGRCSDF
jgi:hypothetical protein